MDHALALLLFSRRLAPLASSIAHSIARSLARSSLSRVAPSLLTTFTVSIYLLLFKRSLLTHAHPTLGLPVHRSYEPSTLLVRRFTQSTDESTHPRTKACDLDCALSTA